MTTTLKNFVSNKKNLTDNLNVAVKFIIKTTSCKTMGDIAKKMTISPSQLSQNMSGDKVPSTNFITKFNTTFNIDIHNPYTFEDNTWLQIFETGEYPDISAKQFITTWIFFRNRINTLKGVVDGLQTTNAELTKTNVLLNQIIHEVEPVLLKTLLSKRSLDKIIMFILFPLISSPIDIDWDIIFNTIG